MPVISSKNSDGVAELLSTIIIPVSLSNLPKAGRRYLRPCTTKV
ncbi:Uncharacterised protein [Cedecea neteri]|uniref:Uncharacterized protein n=1 Tax=Cedecea neteri TaxID=158822 RepID=A0A2X3J5B3_9ENTR|nr:Uncharacterised protein [Cedecea neteri]